MKIQRKAWHYILTLAVAAYIIKNLFVGADIDEGYGIVMGYRLATGDKLLLEMWEPHQTSAIFTALLIKPFLWLTGGSVDFLNLYLRVVCFAIQGIIAVWMYETLWKCVPSLSREEAGYLALFFYVSSPKSIFVPEYSNLQIWFFALLCLCLMRYYCETSPQRGKLFVLAAAGLCLTFDVLAYPSMVLLLPVCLFVILGRHVDHPVMECLVFVAPCVVSFLCFCGYLFSYMTVSQLFEVIPFVLGDGSHEMSLASKGEAFLQNLSEMGVVLAVTFLPAVVFALVRSRINHRNNRQDSFREDTMVLFFLLQIFYQICYWLFSGDNAAQTHEIYLALMLVGTYCYYKNQRKEKTGFCMMLLSMAGYIGICLLSNWGPRFLLPYLIVGAVGGFLCWNSYWKSYAGYWKATLLRILCSVLVLCNVFGFCWLMIGGEQNHSSLLEVRGIYREGFRKGIFSSYMNACRYNTNAERWTELVPDGSTVLYVGPSQFFSMLGDCTIASPNTISTPCYQESLITYWEMNPDRYPDVVVLESWFGDVTVVDESDFIMQWLKNDFCASEIIEDSYVTVYRR